MADKRKNDDPVVPQRGPGFFRQLLEQARLSWALFRDERVPIVAKIIPVAALVYVISPLDVIPDVIPVLGQLDDLGIVLMALNVFNSLAPADVVEEHLIAIRTGRAPQVPQGTKPGGKKETVIDVQSRPVSEQTDDHSQPA